ncbi:iron complex transport system substrate-binding protein [Evansella caseinilytica]|uniref:Iron complex transport system substrate-binding protein n=1 Tax=Evansella caseinilytica TaxID=1503961 RepID=A0A1H3GE78_9BACI|nr:ABC transporter substrate-binding protein [Evansella caseinilytica]SDY01662.1 iron complex transport system substrate-binding protein [Evansella caseinilytica]
MPIKKRYLFLASLFMTALLFGCSDNSNNADDDTGSQEPVADESSDSADSDSGRVLTDAVGHEVTIPDAPEKIIASYLEDYLVALDVTPAAQWSILDGQGLQDYLQDYLQAVPPIPYELPYESVTSFSPDLLLISSAEAVDDGKYEQYSKIAPTYVVGADNNSDWRENLLTIAEVLDLENKAQQLLASYDEKAQAAKEEIQAAIGTDATAAALWLVADSFFIVSENVSSGAVLYEDLGIAVPDVVKEISGDAAANWSPISLEEIATLEADHLFLINSDNASGAEMLNDPVWQSIPAVKNGQVYEYGPETSWLYTGPIASAQMIDHVVESLVK